MATDGPTETFAAHIFAALGDPTRLAIVGRLGAGPASIVALTEGSSMSRQAVTKHLYVLEKAGLVTCARRGRTSLWTLERQQLEEARAALDLLSQQWDDALERLRIFVDG